MIIGLMDNIEIIKKFYTSFQNGDSKGMTECYSDKIIFDELYFLEL